MKNSFISLAIVAMAAMTFSSCGKEQIGSETAADVSRLIVSASEESEADASTLGTRTHLDDELNVIWDSGESMRLFCAETSDAVPVWADSGTAELSDGGKKADFAFTLSGTQSYTNFIYGGIYPSDAVKGNGASAPMSSVRVSLPSSQTPTSSTYDPSAYIMVAKPQTFSAAQTSITQWFRRAVALNKVTLTGLSLASDEKVRSVTFTLSDGNMVAGGRYIDLATGESGEYDSSSDDASSSVSLDYTAPFAVSGESFDAWFTSWNAELAAGQTLSVKLVTDRAEYVRSIVLAKEISFLEGRYNTLTVDMADAVKTLFDPSAVATDNLVAYFPFDTDGTDKIAGLRPTVSPNVTFPSGQRGGALQGADCGYLLYDLPEDSPLRDLKAFAVSFWLKQAAIPYSQAPVPVYFSISRDSDKTWGNLTLTSDRLDPSWNYLNLKAYFRKDGVDWSGQNVPVTNSAFTAGAWKHYVIQYDNVKSEFRIYVDGVCPFTDSGIINRYSNGNGEALGDLCFTEAKQLIIGGWLPKALGTSTDEWMGWFTGGIDEMRFYDRALTAEEVTDLYNAEKGRIDE